MKRALLPFGALLLGFLVASSSGLQAQGMRSTPEDRADRLKEQLTLTNKQTEAVLKIYQDQQKDFEKIREQSMGDREAMRASMFKIVQKTDEKIDKLLDKEQLKKYEELKKKRANRMQRQRPG